MTMPVATARSIGSIEGQTRHKQRSFLHVIANNTDNTLEISLDNEHIQFTITQVEQLRLLLLEWQEGRI